MMAENYVGDGRPFIQIIKIRHLSNCLWATITNILSPNGHVSLYHCLQRFHLRGSEIRDDLSLLDYAARFRGYKMNELIIDVMDVTSALKDTYSEVTAIFAAKKKIKCKFTKKKKTRLMEFCCYCFDWDATFHDSYRAERP